MEDKLRLLVVDDREENRFSFHQLLKDEAYTVDLAASANEALRLLLDHRYACILCDVQMPDIDGLELASIIRADPVLHDTPIIFITAHSYQPTTIYEAFDQGAFDFIQKPVDPVVLRGKLRIFAQLHRSRSLVDQQKLQLETLIAHLAKGMALIQPGGEVDYINQQMMDLLELPPGQASASLLSRLHSLSSFTASEPGAHHPAPLPLGAAFRGRGIKDQLFLIRRGNDELYWQVTLSPLAHAVDGEHAVAMLIRDVTQSTRHELLLRAKNRELEQIAYVASHDLKTPLRHISVFSHLIDDELIEEARSPELQQALSIIQTSSQEMRDLLDGLLEFSRAGRGALSLGPCALEPMLSEIWDHLDLPDDASLKVLSKLPIIFGDGERLKQVLFNLLNNAIKFRHPDRPLVLEVSADPQPTRWLLRVKDNGIGIRPEHQQRVFQIFSRLHNKDDYPGHGLGLAVVRTLIERHNGRVQVESDGHSGTTFCIELPRLDPMEQLTGAPKVRRAM